MMLAIKCAEIFPKHYRKHFSKCNTSISRLVWLGGSCSFQSMSLGQLREHVMCERQANVFIRDYEK